MEPEPLYSRMVSGAEPDAPAAVTQPLSYSMLLLHRLGDAAFSVYPLLTQLPSTYTDR